VIAERANVGAPIVLLPPGSLIRVDLLQFFVCIEEHAQLNVALRCGDVLLFFGFEGHRRRVSRKTTMPCLW
jgi:hypothetical protein